VCVVVILGNHVTIPTRYAYDDGNVTETTTRRPDTMGTHTLPNRFRTYVAVVV